MTDWIYQLDAYVQSFEAVVEASDDAGVVLDRSAFYPGGGGQPHDLGRLQGGGQEWPVVGMRRALSAYAGAHGNAHPLRCDLA